MSEVAYQPNHTYQANRTSQDSHPAASETFSKSQNTDDGECEMYERVHPDQHEFSDPFTRIVNPEKRNENEPNKQNDSFHTKRTEITHLQKPNQQTCENQSQTPNKRPLGFDRNRSAPKKAAVSPVASNRQQFIPQTHQTEPK